MHTTKTNPNHIDSTELDTASTVAAKPRRRGRLVAGIVGLGLAAGTVAVVAGAPIAGARACVDTNPGWRYRNVHVSSYEFRGVGPVYSVRNRSNATASYTVTTQTSGTVGASLSVGAEAEMKAAIFGGVKASTNLTVSGSVTISRGESTSISVRPYSTVYAQRGVSRVKVSGTAVRLDRCGRTVQSQYVTAAMPYAKTWDIHN